MLRFFVSLLYAERAICYRPSICSCITRVDQSNMVELRVVQFSPHSSPIPLLLRDKFHPEILRSSPKWWRQTRVGWGTSYFHSSNAFARWLHRLELLSLVRCPNSKLFARWLHCRALTVASAGLFVVTSDDNENVAVCEGYHKNATGQIHGDISVELAVCV